MAAATAAATKAAIDKYNAEKAAQESTTNLGNIGLSALPFTNILTGIGNIGNTAADAITGGSDKPKGPTVDVEPIQDESGNVIPNQPITNQPAPNNTALPPQATIDGIKSA